MLGWSISVYRQTDKGTTPATEKSPRGTYVAYWGTDVGGLKWIDELVKEGKAIELGGNGYPYYYTAPAEHLIPTILNDPPGALKTFVRGESEILEEMWKEKSGTVINQTVVSICRPDEWLLVEAWDKS